MLQLHQQYPVAQTFAFTYRMDKAYWGVLQHGAERAVSKLHTPGKAVDRVGSGDCFMAGLIYGLYHQHTPAEIIGFAAAAAVGKLKEKGDSTSQHIGDVMKIMQAYERKEITYN